MFVAVGLYSQSIRNFSWVEKFLFINHPLTTRLSVLVNAIDCWKNVIRKGTLHETSFRHFLCHIICNFRSNLLETFFFFFFSFSPILPKKTIEKCTLAVLNSKRKFPIISIKCKFYTINFPFFPHPIQTFSTWCEDLIEDDSIHFPTTLFI